MPSKIIPEKTGSGVVQQGKALIESVSRVQRPLAAAIYDGPDLFDVVGCGRSVGPKVTIGGNISSDIKVVKYSELQGQFVLVRGDLSTVHSQ